MRRYRGVEASLLLPDVHQADLAGPFFNLSASYTASTRDFVFAGALRTTEYSICTCLIRSFVGFRIIGSTIVALLFKRRLTTWASAARTRTRSHWPLLRALSKSAPVATVVGR